MDFDEYVKEMAKPPPELDDPHCETLEELTAWAKTHGCANIVYHRNLARIMANRKDSK